MLLISLIHPQSLQFNEMCRGKSAFMNLCTIIPLLAIYANFPAYKYNSILVIEQFDLISLVIVMLFILFLPKL